MEENNAIFQPHFTSTPSNTKIPTLDVRYHAQTIFKGFAKVRKSAQFEICAHLLYINGLVKAIFSTFSCCRKLLNKQNGVKFT